MPTSSSQDNARRTLFLLWSVFAIAQLDRQIFSLSLDAISTEFGLSDWQLGLLSGFAFALVFVLVGFPVAALCARYNRRNIVSTSVFVWSSFIIAMAFAQSFVALFIARVGIGAGEAGAVAPAHSIISDLFPERKRASALSTFATGANFGILLAALIGGVIGQFYGWRVAFVVAGFPGIIVAVLLYRYGTEPPRSKMPDDVSVFSVFTASFKAIISDPGTRFALLAFMMIGIMTFAMLAWIPTLLIRQYGIDVAQVGLIGVFAAGFVGAAGTYLCGQAIDRVGLRQPRYRIYGIIVTIIAHTMLGITFLLSQTLWIGVVFFAMSSFFAIAFWGPTFAFVYGRIESHLRPMATAFFLLSFNLIGMAVGPTLVGGLSDTLFTNSGALSLGYALLVIKVFAIASVWFYYKMAMTIPRLA